MALGCRVVTVGVLLLAVVCGTVVSEPEPGPSAGPSAGPTKLDDYVLNTQSECYKSKRILSCFKYRFSRYLWSFATGRMSWFATENSAVDSTSGLKLVRLNEPKEDDVFPEARQMSPYDSELVKGAKFLQRSLNTFIASHGVQVGMGAESGARFLADDDFEARGKKQKQRKWSLILPLAVMLKLVHLKLLLKPILLGVGLIQLLLIAGGLLIFHFFRNTNICKIQPHVIHAHSHIASESAPELSYAAYGAYPSYSASPYNAYNKDWASNRAYSGYSFLDAIDNHKI
ncbi:uncharacterized protein LOC131288667 [Anopheles ziemanni]|uniref:uncharacterized protein LOC131259493 n=1 Tax=Anopheles coustani TaxID=139045 RepID=UPI00265839D1|nr:uncharacterized protein LOC131259493 [Anopheles coustani]XP_058173809.1 uncharacterized protein LOC131288667 [Anopheles ziemanni]